MTNPSEARRLLHELIPDWRARAKQSKEWGTQEGGHDESYADGAAGAYEACANNLEALLPVLDQQQQDLDTLREACAIIIKAFDKGVFVRSTERDNNPKWAIELLPYIGALKRLQREAKRWIKGL